MLRHLVEHLGWIGKYMYPRCIRCEFDTPDAPTSRLTQVCNGSGAANRFAETANWCRNPHVSLPHPLPLFP